MKKSPGEATTARNLEEKFDRGEDVLDYFDVAKARVISPRSKGSAVKTKFAYPAKRNSDRRAGVRIARNFGVRGRVRALKAATCRSHSEKSA